MFLARHRSKVRRESGPGRRGRPSYAGRVIFRPGVESLEDRVLLDAGLLDPSFGTAGRVLTDLGMELITAGTTVQPDGKIVVAGTVMNGGDSDFFVARYNADGSLDAGFGTEGVVTTDFRSGNDVAHGLALQPDGKVVVVGSADGPLGVSFRTDFALARYNADGSPDAGFGTGGTVLTIFPRGFGHSLSSAEAVALQGDGKIVAVGSTANSATLGSHFALARYNPDGSPDVDFGAGGTVSVTTRYFAEANGATGVALQADGKAVVVGTSHATHVPLIACSAGVSTDPPPAKCPVVPTSALVLARFNADGSVDDGFGRGGAVVELFTPSGASGSGVALQADGRIVVVGSAGGDFALARYLMDGSLDPTFGTGGRVLTDFGSRWEGAQSVALQSDGQIVVAGWSRAFDRITPGSDTDFALARYNTDGSLDAGFGSGGLVLTDFGGPDAAAAIALQSDGRIVAVGGSHPLRGSALALARYLA